MSLRKKGTLIKRDKMNPLLTIWYELIMYAHANVQSMNTSKMFAGCMIITLNIASKFVNIKVSKTMESYLKHSFSRDALIFAIAWVGSRDIYTACIIVTIFVICVDFLFNEDCSYCILPKSFCNYHINLLNNEGFNGSSDKVITPEEIKAATELLVNAKIQSMTKNPLNTEYTHTTP